MVRIFTILIISTVIAYSASAQSFVSSSAGDLTLDAGNSLATVAGDYNNDGYTDIFVGNHNNQQNKLYKNNGDGTFTVDAGSVVSNDLGYTIGAAWADYDNDGWLDLYVVNSASDNFLYKNNGDGTFTKQLSSVTISGGSYGCAWGDYNSDGFVDLVVTSYGAALKLYHNNGDGTFKEVTLSETVISSPMANWVDWNRDNHLDLFVINQGSSNLLYTNDGDGTFTPETTLNLTTEVDNYWSSTWGDFNNDSWPDVFISTTDGNNYLYINNGSGFNKVILSSTGYASYGSTTGDIDNDGDLDIITSNWTGSPYLYLNNGSGSFSISSFGYVNNSYGTLLFDANNDGLLDVYQSNWDNTTPNDLFINTTANSNNYINIKLQGLNANPSALGATHIMLYTPNKVIRRSLYGVNGFGGQNPLDFHIGLGTDIQVDELYVRWPDGTSRVYTDLEINTDNTILGMGPNLRSFNYSNIYNKVTRGEEYYINFYIENYEQYEAGNFNIEYYISSDDIIDESDHLLSNLEMDPLEAYSGRWAEVSPIIPGDFTLGSYQLLIQVDAGNNVSEYNEEDNLIILPLEIIDYQVTNLIAYTSLNRHIYNPGTEIDYYNSAAYNNTELEVNDTSVDYFLSEDDIFNPEEDLLLFSENVSLGAYEYVELNPNLQIPSGQQVGPYYLLTVIDSDNLVEEKSEDDNISYWGIEVVNDPIAPENLSATPISSTRIDLTWKDNSSTETQFLIYRNEVLLSSVAANVETYSDVTVTAGTEYEYRVAASNGSTSNVSQPVYVIIDSSTDGQILEQKTNDITVTDLGLSVTSAWGDYNNDGYVDLFVGNYGQNNFLYQNNGNNTFTKITGIEPVNNVENTTNASWADFNNDGWLDIFVVNENQSNRLFKNNGDGTFTDVGVSSGVAESGTKGVTWGDYNQDGYLDLFVTSDAGANNNLYKNNGDETFSSETIAGLTDVGQESINAVWFHANYDSWLDLLVINYNEANKLFINDQEGSFEEFTSGELTRDVSASWGASISDYDNDGDNDVYITNKGESNTLYENSGWIFEKVISGVEGGNANSESSAWADFDNDGDQDLFVANVDQNNMLFRNNSDGTFTSLVTGSVGNEGALTSTSASWADINNDGFEDLFVANANQNNLLYINSTNSNNFITLKLKGVAENSSAIGAKIYVSSTDGVENRDQYKSILANTGSRGQNDLDVTFGLGTHAEIANLSILWPNDEYKEYDLEINQEHIIYGLGPELSGAFNDNMSEKANQGGDLFIDGLLRNQASYDVDSVEVVYVLSADDVYDDTDDVLDTVVVYDLGHYSLNYPNLNFFIPQDYPLGQYNLLMLIDPNNLVMEINEENNLVVSPLEIIDYNLPDITIYLNNRSRWNYNAGTDLEYIIEISNIGDADATDIPVNLYMSQDNQLSDDDEFLGTRIFDLSVGQSVNVDTTYSLSEALTADDYFFFAVVDEGLAIEEKSEENNSSYIEFYIVEYPASPSGLSVTALSDTELSLSWSDNSNNENQFVIERNNTEIATVGENVTSYIDNNVTPETHYEYAVRAVNDLYQSSRNNRQFNFLASPINPSIHVLSENELELSWEDNSSNEEQYVIERNGTEISTTEADVTSFNDNDVSAENEYTYTIQAIRWDGHSAATEVTKKILFAPTELTASVVSDTEINLTWIDNTTGESEYVVERNGTEIAFLGANVSSYNDTGLSTGEQYSYRVRANESHRAESPYSEEVTIVVQTDVEGPQIVIQQDVREHIIGSNSKFVIEVTDPSGVYEVYAAYIGMAEELEADFYFQLLTETGTPGVYEFNLNDEMFDELGLDVVFLAYDNKGNESESDLEKVYRVYEGGDIQLNTLNPGITQDAYRIIAVPLSLDQPNAENVFELLGEYDPENWRMFHYQSGTNREYGSGWTNIVRGLGYWFLFEGTGNVITLGSGDISLPNDEPFTISLSSGWNQIGNPYLWNLSWADILEYNNMTLADISELYFFYNNYDTDDLWIPYEGAFVNAPSSMELIIPHFKDPAVNGRKKIDGFKDKGRIEEKSWEINLTLQAGNKQNTMAGIGMNIDADNSRDQYDRLTPPRFMEHLEMNFTHPEFYYPHFTRDIVKTQDSYTWDFTVESNINEEYIILSWDKTIAEGSFKKLILHDTKSNKILDMAEYTSYTFNNEDISNFRIIYGNQDYIDEQINSITTEILQAYPNPFTSEISMPFILKGSDVEYEVELSIVSINGEKLLTLFNEKLTSGYHRYTWNGKLPGGTELSAGIYVQELIVKDGYNEEVYRIKLMKQ